MEHKCNQEKILTELSLDIRNLKEGNDKLNMKLEKYENVLNETRDNNIVLEKMVSFFETSLNQNNELNKKIMQTLTDISIAINNTNNDVKNINSEVSNVKVDMKDIKTEISSMKEDNTINITKTIKDGIVANIIRVIATVGGVGGLIAIISQQVK